jgi:hypothetical protein
MEDNTGKRKLEEIDGDADCTPTKVARLEETEPFFMDRISRYLFYKEKKTAAKEANQKRSQANCNRQIKAVVGEILEAGIIAEMNQVEANDLRLWYRSHEDETPSTTQLVATTVEPTVKSLTASSINELEVHATKMRNLHYEWQPWQVLADNLRLGLRSCLENWKTDSKHPFASTLANSWEQIYVDNPDMFFELLRESVGIRPTAETIGGILHRLKKIKISCSDTQVPEVIGNWQKELCNFFHIADDDDEENMNNEQKLQKVKILQTLIQSVKFAPQEVDAIFKQEFIVDKDTPIKELMETAWRKYFFAKSVADTYNSASVSEHSSSSGERNKSHKLISNTGRSNDGPFHGGTCWGCGHAGHKKVQCRYKNLHPDFNKERVPWEVSTTGKAYKSAGLSTLNPYTTLKDRKEGKKSDKPIYIAAATTAKSGESQIESLSMVKATLIIKDRETDVTILIDTGALQADYISRDLVLRENLENSELAAPLRVFSGIGDSHSLVINYCSAKLVLSDTTRIFTIETDLNVIDCVFDVILGMKTIIKYDMLSWLQARIKMEGDFSYDSVATILSKEDVFDYESEEDDPFEFYDRDIPTYDVSTDISKIQIYGSEEFRKKALALCQEFGDIFASTVDAAPAKVTPLTLEIDENKWLQPRNRLPARPQGREREMEIDRQVQEMLYLGIIQPSQAEAYSQVVLVKKPNNRFRMCIDYRSLNECMARMEWPIPLIASMLRNIGSKKAKLFAVMDLTSGYHQMPLHGKSTKYTAFKTSKGLFEYTRVPFGLMVAGSYFQQKMVCEVLPAEVHTICEVYLDDVLTWGQTEDELLDNLRTIFTRYREAGIKVNPEKTRIGMNEIEYVGHTISGDGLSFTKEKLMRVLDFPKPTTLKSLQKFVGMVNYFSSHIRNYSNLMRPLNELKRGLTKPGSVIVWDEEADQAFESVKHEIENCPTLFFIDESAPITLMTDASDYGIGAYLYQTIAEQEQPIAFVSKSLQKSQLNWSTVEKECYAIYYACMSLEYLIRDVKFTIKTDHHNLRYMNVGLSPKVKRWKLALQEFDFKIETIPGIANEIADSLSRLCHDYAAPITEETADSEILITPEQWDNIARVHNSMVGHFGIDETIRRLDDFNHKWRNRREHVKSFISKCVVCQKLSQAKISVTASKFYLSTLKPMECVSIDTIGPLEVDDRGNQHIITMIDNFTRWVELYPAPDTSAVSAARGIISLLGHYGCPKYLLSDRGPQYVNEVVTEITKYYSINRTQSTPYSHEENGIVERANKEVMRHLRAIIYDDDVIVRWSDVLPLVQRIMNAHVHEAIGVSPAQILFGNAITLDPLLEQSTDSIVPLMRTEYADQIVKAQRAILKIAKIQQTEAQQAHISNQSSTVTVYPEGSLVLMKNSNITKTSPKFSGPYKVIFNKGNTYRISHLATGRVYDRDIHMLKVFEYDPRFVDPQAVAAEEHGLDIVENILAHKGKGKNMMFQTKWVDSDIITWEPIENMKNNILWKRYIHGNNLIPSLPIAVRRWLE